MPHTHSNIKLYMQPTTTSAPKPGRGRPRKGQVIYQSGTITVYEPKRGVVAVKPRRSASVVLFEQLSVFPPSAE